MDAQSQNQQADQNTPIAPTPDLAAAVSAVKPAGKARGQHSHNGQDTPMLDPNTALLGFPVVTAAPSYTEIEGKVVLSNVGSVYGLYARIAGAWRSLGAAASKYGAVYATASHNLTLTNAAQLYTAGIANMIDGISGGGVTPDQANYRVLPVAGDYRVTASISFSVDRTCKLELGASNSGAIMPSVYAELDIVTAGKLHAVSVTGLVTLTTAGVSLKIMTDTAGAVMTIERVSLNISSV